jgi:hypothetical protein
MEYWSGGWGQKPSTPSFQYSNTPTPCNSNTPSLLWVVHATFDTFSFVTSTENPFSSHQCATSLPVANQTPLCDFM